MQNTAILIDTNVLLNYLTNRDDPFKEQSVEVVRRCAQGDYIGYIAFHSLSTIWYVLRKWDDDRRRKCLYEICNIFKVASPSQTKILDAINDVSFTDFEDCLQDKCAREVDALYIITCNINDYANSETIALTPDEFIKIS